MVGSFLVRHADPSPRDGLSPPQRRLKATPPYSTGSGTRATISVTSKRVRSACASKIPPVLPMRRIGKNGTHFPNSFRFFYPLVIYCQKPIPLIVMFPFRLVVGLSPTARGGASSSCWAKSRRPLLPLLIEGVPLQQLPTDHQKP